MIWVFRYIGVHLWLTTLVAVPVSFYSIPRLSGFGLAVSPLFFSALIFTITGLLIGFLMDISAKKRIISLIAEGQAWERSGIAEKAKEKYILALRVFDSFLLWPLSVKKTARKLTGVIAGFQLNNPGDNQNFKKGTAVYLRMNPLDADMAQLWLSQLTQANIVSAFEQEVLYLLARIHMENAQLLSLLANIFLGLHRRDLIAKKVYQKVMERPDLAKIYQNRIRRLTDEPEGDTHIRQAVFSTPEEPPIEKSGKTAENALKLVSGFLVTINKIGHFLLGVTRSAAQQAVLFINRSVFFFKVHGRFRFYFKTSLLVVFLAGFLFFITSTFVHMFKTRTIEQKQTVQEKLIPTPFTIQVAAYLKSSHARNYVDTLKKKQIDASIKKVEGGGKTWFVVRVSQFTDKDSATDYGNTLKQQQIIEDFFVTNR